MNKLPFILATVLFPFVLPTLNADVGCPFQQMGMERQVTPEQRAALRERFEQRIEQVTPEQRAALRERLQQRMESRGMHDQTQTGTYFSQDPNITN